MTRFLLDTGTAGDYINRRRDVYAQARAAVARGHRVGIGLPVLAELWYGGREQQQPGSERRAAAADAS